MLHFIVVLCSSHTVKLTPTLFLRRVSKIYNGTEEKCLVYEQRYNTNI